jgi:large subunit ribosomal protein L10
MGEKADFARFRLADYGRTPWDRPKQSLSPIVVGTRRNQTGGKALSGPSRQIWRDAVDRAQKAEMVDDIGQIFAKSGSVVVARYAGLTVAQMTDLRQRFGAAGAQFKVIKNRLAKIALDNSGNGASRDMFVEPTGIAYSDDPVAPAKVAAEFAKTNQKFIIIGGFLGKQTLSENEVKALAVIPSLDELRAQLCGVLNAPATKLARTLNAPAVGLATVLDAFVRKQGEGQEAA